MQCEECEECELSPWDAAALGPLDPEAGLASLPLSAADAALRRTYLREKKVPQLRWMLRQVPPLSSRSPLISPELAGRSAR